MTLGELEILEQKATPANWEFIGVDYSTKVYVRRANQDIDMTDDDDHLVCATRNALPQLLEICKTARSLLIGHPAWHADYMTVSGPTMRKLRDLFDKMEEDLF